MDKDLLIHQYLDGEISSAGEAELFSLLASSDEAKLSFKKQLAVKTAIKNDTAAYTAPASSAVSIFSELGIASALGAGAVSAAGTSTWFSNLWGSYSQAILTFLGTATVALVVFMGLEFGDSNYSNNNENKEIIASENYQNNQNGVISSNSNAGIGNSNEIENTIIKYVFTDDLDKLSGAEKIKAEEYFLTNASALSTFENQLSSLRGQNNYLQNTLAKSKAFIEKFENNESSQNSFSNVSNYKSNLLNNSIQERKNKSSNSLNQINFSDLDLSSNLNTGKRYRSNQIFGGDAFSSPELSNSQNTFVVSKLPYNLELSMLNDFNLSNTNNELTTNQFDNFRLELSLNTSENWAFGVDIRNENFYQKYNYIVDGQPYIFEQNPNFWVASGMLKYSPDFMNGSVLGVNQSGFAQLTLGAGTPGPVGRLMVGTQFNILSNLYIKTGLEYSYLNYVQNNLNYQTDKISLQFGIGFSNR